MVYEETVVRMNSKIEIHDEDDGKDMKKETEVGFILRRGGTEKAPLSTAIFLMDLFN